jgi:hypothetical protein
MIVVELITDKGLYGRQPIDPKTQFKQTWVDSLFDRKYLVLGFLVSRITTGREVLHMELFAIPETLYKKKIINLTINIGYKEQE